jgi:hypothetical protein
VFSFKLRGAYNKMARLPQAALARGVIAASAGNHAQGVALSAQKLGCKAVIVMPVTTPRIKIDAVTARGAKVVLAGDSYSDAYTTARELATKGKLTFDPPLRRPGRHRRPGHGGMEMLQRHSGPLDAIFVAGRRRRTDRRHRQLREGAPIPDIRVIGVEPVDCRRDDAVAARRSPREARERRAVRRRRRREAGRRRDLPPRPQGRRRHDPGRQRRHLRRHQGRLRGHAHRPRAGRRTGGRRREAPGSSAIAPAARRTRPSRAART